MVLVLLLCKLLAANLADATAAGTSTVSAASLKPTAAQLASLASVCGQAAFPADCTTKCTVRNCLVCKAGHCLCCDRGFAPSANGRACQACPFPFTTTRPGCTKCDGEL